MIVPRKHKVESELIPNIGDEYMFYDDGKITWSRQYKAKVEHVITPEDAKFVNLDAWRDPETGMIETITNHSAEPDAVQSLYDRWREEIWDNTDGTGEPYLYDIKTDFFVGCSIPEYDKNEIWFVRTVNGGWFSLDIQSFWQGGVLDVNGARTKSLEQINNK